MKKEKEEAVKETEEHEEEGRIRSRTIEEELKTMKEQEEESK